jgi:predicted metalloprotease with PDZ domain
MTPSYELSVADARTHFFQVRFAFRKTGDQTLLRLPAWIPGSYMIRDFSRHIRGFQVQCKARDLASPSRTRAAASVHVLLKASELDKDTWSIDTSKVETNASIVATYEVYAFDRSVRTAYLDHERAFMNASSLLMYVVGAESLPCEITLRRPTGIARAKLATGLEPIKIDRAGFGRYFARNYDELIDCPVEMADFTEFSFRAGGAQHRFVITGAHPADLSRLRKDVAAICETQCELFEPVSKKAPFRSYVFMLNVLGSGYGGLEHRNSTALICSRSDLEPANEGYQTLLGLISHEYFHAWNVKRIKPQAFAPYQLREESYTRLLWVFEGFTSYYDDLLALRSGAFSMPDYFRALGKTITQVLNNSGRNHQSLESSSFFAWTKYYKQDENSPNSIVSYYTKGALVGLCLDLSIRLKTKHKYSLDDVMRHLWQRYGRDFYGRDFYGRDFDKAGKGLAEGEFSTVLREACGLDMSRELKAWTQGTDDLPLQDLLASFGITMTLENQSNLESLLGAKFKTTGLGLEITQVKSDSSAERGGLASGDTIIAYDCLRVTEEGLCSALRSLDGNAAVSTKKKQIPDKSLDLLVFRSDALISVILGGSSTKLLRTKLELTVRPDKAARHGQLTWLGQPPTIAR